MIETGNGGMRMRIDETGEDGGAAKINLFCSAGCKTQHLVIRLTARNRPPETATAWARG